MKKLFVITSLLSFSFLLRAQDKLPLSGLLTSYYGVKDALVAGDSKTAAAKAGELVKAVSAVDMKSLPEKDHMAFMSVMEKLSYDARHISESTDINHQREHFTALSANMYTLAKGAHLSSQPIYADYCPMKKATWLSGESVIKNPYFGSSMPDCGQVKATIKP